MATYPRRGFASVADLHTVEEDRAATNHENPTVRYNRFLFSDLRANKYVGPVTDRFLKTQYFWAELKLWDVYDRMKPLSQAAGCKLITFEIRLACCWFFGPNYMDVDASYVWRKIRNNLLVRERLSEREMPKHSLSEPRACLVFYPGVFTSRVCSS